MWEGLFYRLATRCMQPRRSGDSEEMDEDMRKAIEASLQDVAQSPQQDQDGHLAVIG